MADAARGGGRRLGFDIGDVKVLLDAHAHFDHAGGLRELQPASGAELWISAGDAAGRAMAGHIGRRREQREPAVAP